MKAEAVAVRQRARDVNPFFYHDGIGWKVSSKVMVEILYTEDIDIRHRPLIHMTNVHHQTGKRRNPQKKNPNCPACNLKHVL